MTPDERQKAESAIAEYDRLSEVRDVYAELHRIIDEWEIYKDDVKKALGCLIGDAEYQARLLAHMLKTKTTREALFSAIGKVIDEYEKRIEAI